MSIDDTFHGLTTLISIDAPGIQAGGTGFYYQRLAPAKTDKDPEWRAVENVWLVTKRHVVLSGSSGYTELPTVLTFHLRRRQNGKLSWEPIVLPKEELAKRVKVHPNSEIDVCIIEVLDLITEKLKENPTEYIVWHAVHAGQLPGKNNIDIEVSDDAIVIGYPRGYYDDVNLFPIVKSGIIASRWGLPFQGKPYFLIDAKLFPGSSGSVVVSKPQSIAVVNGQMLFAANRQFALLGIFSGEPYWEESPLEFDDMTIIRKSGYNVGIVWYAHLIDEIIDGGVAVEAQ